MTIPSLEGARSPGVGEEYVCMFWNTTVERWSRDGCRKLNTSANGHMRCACTHLTDFAVGIQPKEVIDLLEDLSVAHIVNEVSFSIARIKENPFAVYALGVILVLGLLLATEPLKHIGLFMGYPSETAQNLPKVL